MTDLQTRIAKLRTMTGRPERILRTFVCARVSQPFVTVFERTDPREKFKLVDVQRASAGTGKASASSEQAKTFQASDFDLAGYHCPHCSSREPPFIDTFCGNSFCGHGYRQVGAEKVYDCPVCRKTYNLVNATEISASEQSQAGTGAARTSNLLGGPRPTAFLPRR